MYLSINVDNGLGFPVDKPPDAVPVNHIPLPEYIGANVGSKKVVGELNSQLPIARGIKVLSFWFALLFTNVILTTSTSGAEAPFHQIGGVGVETAAR